jgi:AAA family ATP:ADP antiporter
MEDATRQAVSRARVSEGNLEKSGTGRVRDAVLHDRPPGPAGRLRMLLGVREDEVGPLAWAMTFLFSLLGGNYLIRPLRDETGIAGGTSHLPSLFAGTLLAMLVAAPLLSARLRRPGGPDLAPIFRGLQLVLMAFFVAFGTLPAAGHVWAARAFFIWASVANLLIVSMAWGTLAGRFTSEQAHRLFGLIAAGGTLGAISGSALAGWLAERAGTTTLLLAAATLLELGLLASSRLVKTSPSSECATRAIPMGSPLEAAGCDRGPGRSGYLAGLVLWTLLFTTTSAVVYMEQARIVSASLGNPATRTAFFARIDLLVNLLGLAVQFTLTGRALALLGAGGTTAILPVVTMLGVIVLVLNPTVATIKWFQVIRRAVDYALARPGREVYYTVVGRAELLRTKGLIDTAVYRAGDAAGAWAYGLLTALPGVPDAAPLAVVPLSLAWIALSLGLGRSMKRCLADKSGSPGKTRGPWC